MSGKTISVCEYKEIQQPLQGALDYLGRMDKLLSDCESRTIALGGGVSYGRIPLMQVQSDARMALKRAKKIIGEG